MPRPKRSTRKPAKGSKVPLPKKPVVVLPVPPDTEVEAYGFIREQLRELGWTVKSPSTGTGGQVWTQNQCFAHPEIKQAFGLTRPENVVKLSEKAVWIIEAKAARKQLQLAIDEATTFYAKRINEHPDCRLRAVLASGVAGSEEKGYLIRTRVWLDGKWVPVSINGQEATGLLSPGDVRTLFELGGSDIHEFAPPQRLFLQAAERINEILHEGGINKNDRAKTMAALLLAVVDEPPNLDTKLPVLIAEINGRSEAVLKANDKPDFAPFVRILPPTNTTNHIKFRNALVRTIQELQNLNIRSAMDSSTDVLGQFYEVFLKYGNGAKEIGIVLTPRHVTRFAVEALGVAYNDLVLDPACGTGGFLVAAFDHVRRAATPSQLEQFKEYNLFGIEQESYVAVLAIVNMIFRGDGKHNIIEGNCFSTNLSRRTVDGQPSAAFTKAPARPGNEPITRVLMNPPFALRGSLDQEYRFVTRALAFMADGGLLFSLLPMDAMFGARDEKVWRADELLAHHTLLAVVSLPDELFYPAAQKQVVGIIVKKGIPHPKSQNVFWARVAHDGHLKLKSRRLPGGELVPPRDEPDDLPSILPSLRAFIAHPASVSVNMPLLSKTAPIDFSDPLLELLPEAYVDSPAASTDDLGRAVDSMARDSVAFFIRADRDPLIGDRPPWDLALGSFPLSALYDLAPGDYHSLSALKPGSIPVVSCGDVNNGVSGYYDVQEHLYERKLTIAFNGMNTLTAKYHPYTFAAKDDVAVCTPRRPLRITTELFIQVMVNRERWRYSYYRKCFAEKLGRFSVSLPMKDGDIDEDTIQRVVEATPYWHLLRDRLGR